MSTAQLRQVTAPGASDSAVAPAQVSATPATTSAAQAAESPDEATASTRTIAAFVFGVFADGAELRQTVETQTAKASAGDDVECAGVSAATDAGDAAGTNDATETGCEAVRANLTCDATGSNGQLDLTSDFVFANGAASESSGPTEEKNSLKPEARGASAAAHGTQPAEEMHMALPSMSGVTAEGTVANMNGTDSTTQKRTEIAQQIQPGPGVLGVQTLTADTAGSFSSSSGGKNANSGGGARQNSSPNATQASPSRDAKGQISTATAGAETGGVAPRDAQPTGATGTIPTNDSAAGSDAIQMAHAAAQATAQATTLAHAATDATSGAKTPNEPIIAQSAASSTPLPMLPRSLGEVSQATQLYQRMSGAEMHVSMDTDLLGSIDLRAVMHQGSLSATIAVQRPDVQSLLVNELPALQHSLAEKNLQVGQISVTAGSVGSEANPQEQTPPDRRQPQTQTAQPMAPVYGDGPPVSPLPATAAAAARAIGRSRLSVIA